MLWVRLNHVSKRGHWFQTGTRCSRPHCASRQPTIPQNMIIFNVMDYFTHLLSTIALSRVICLLYEHLNYKRPTKADVTYLGRIMLFCVSFKKWSRLLVNVMLLSTDEVTMIFTVKRYCQAPFSPSKEAVLKVNQPDWWTKLSRRVLQ